MKFSMTGREKYDILIQVTASTGLTVYITVLNKFHRHHNDWTVKSRLTSAKFKIQQSSYLHSKNCFDSASLYWSKIDKLKFWEMCTILYLNAA